MSSTARVAPFFLLPLLGACGGPAEPVTPAGATGGDAAAPAASASTAAAPAKPKVDIAALFARELAAPLGKQAVAAPASRFSSSVEASAAPTITVEKDITTVTIPIGTESAILCHVSTERLDAAGTIGNFLKGLDSSIQLQTAKVTEVGVAGDAPILFMEAEYLAKTPEGMIAGLVKGAVQPASSGSLFCLHDEAGYRTTFQRVVRGFATEAKRTPAAGAPVPRHYSIALVKIGEFPIGFVETDISDAEKGGRMTVEYMSSLVPQGRGSLMAVDEAEVQTVDKAGVLVSGMFWSQKDGAESRKLNVKRVKAKEYAVEGTQDGKPVNATIKAPKEISNAFAKRAELKALSAKATGELKIPSFSPSNATDAVSDEVFRAIGGGNLSLELGKNKATVHVDADGLYDRIEVPAGQVSVVIKREMVKGKL